MPNVHKTPLLGWHPSSAGLSAWARAEAERRGVPLARVLDEALAEYQEMTDRLAGLPRCGWCDGPRCPFAAVCRVTDETGDGLLACVPHAEWLLSRDPGARREDLALEDAVRGSGA